MTYTKYPRFRVWIALLLASCVVALTGCNQYPADEYGEIQMDDWCDRDDSHPWTGCWEEVAQIECNTGHEFVPEDTIGEMRLRMDGLYSVTRHPFEHFVDYSGTYTVTESSNSIEFSALDLPGFSGQGTYQISDEGDLLLEGIWFGVYDSPDESSTTQVATVCGYSMSLK